MASRYMKDAKCQWSSGEYKSKPQWDTPYQDVSYFKKKKKKNVEKLEPLYTVGGNAKWYSHYSMEFPPPPPKKIELPNDLAILLLDIYPKELKSVA